MSDSSPNHEVCSVCGAAMSPGSLCVACALGDAFGEAGEVAEGSLGRIGGHELIEIIARGGMGIVYRARQRNPEREVALKALPGATLLSEEARQRFKIEAQAMAKLEHPAILPVYELGEDSDTPFFTMKLAAGGSLAQRLIQYQGKWREIAELTASIAEAVQFAHERGVLHRDLKPGNILFDQAGKPFVSDFGLAKIIGHEADLTRTIALMGTPNYMAPELTRGGKGAGTTASDVWSLGILLYELLSGALPFCGDNIATVLRQIEEDQPSQVPHAPHDLMVIANKSLRKEPRHRYASAGALADDLRLWLRGEPIQARKTSSSPFRSPPAPAAHAWHRHRDDTPQTRRPRSGLIVAFDAFDPDFSHSPRQAATGCCDASCSLEESLRHGSEKMDEMPRR